MPRHRVQVCTGFWAHVMCYTRGMRYLFYLRSGASVIVTIPGGIGPVLDAIAQKEKEGWPPDGQWIASPGLTESVRWTEIEGWRLVRD